MTKSAPKLDQQQLLSRLAEMREFGGAAVTTGLDDTVVTKFLATHDELSTAIDRAYAHFCAARERHPDFVLADERDQIKRAQAGYTNFYGSDAINPFVSAGAAGPWQVTLKGAVIYDCGGYGMLGFGHAPTQLLQAMDQPHVMANVMTPSVSQMEFVAALRAEIGHTRSDGTPFESFLCLNSGSESTSIASRIADINTKLMTDPGAEYEGWQVRGLTLEGSFHGRTDRPARYSDSTLGNYREHLASYQGDDYLLTVPPNNVQALEAVFADARENNVFIEAFFMEPVMGEGNPGESITTDFYKRARELTAEHHTMLVIDSIQAGLRAHGVLSIVDYPEFESLPAPDMEAYSKALNGGQYPLSVLALSAYAAGIYQQGLYGNTMTTNPRALDVAKVVLAQLDDQLRNNIRKQGRSLVDKLKNLTTEVDDSITGTQGTGLLLSCELHPRFKCYGTDSTEDYLRRNGLGVIHGGKRSLRFTPVFSIGDDEVDLIVDCVRNALENGPLN